MEEQQLEAHCDGSDRWVLCAQYTAGPNVYKYYDQSCGAAQMLIFKLTLISQKTLLCFVLLSVLGVLITTLLGLKAMYRMTRLLDLYLDLQSSISELNGIMALQIEFEQDVFEIDDKDKTNYQASIRKRKEKWLEGQKRQNEERAIVLEIGYKYNKLRTRLLAALHVHESFIPVSIFDECDLPEAFQLKEVVDCVHSLARQTVLVVRVVPPNERGKAGFSSYPLGSGRLWRVQKQFSQMGDRKCPCNDCKNSENPEVSWGEYIVVTRKWNYNTIKVSHYRFVLGYVSDESLSEALVLRAVSVIRSDKSLDFSEVLCITHDLDTSRKVEAICRRNSDDRRKLLDKCHIFRKGKKLAVLVSHAHFGPKQICVGEWLENEGDGTLGSFSHVYTAAACSGSPGGPVLLVDGSNANVSIHKRWNLNRSIGKSCGHVWSL